ncbi:hypothetical protein [Rhodanobacter glycinis]|jgi:hypothetical protein|uniref:hypothetical protein n=1 Tax=Rhodanobacter glycinis TaxID=582702 RepID=UPI000B872781|nr:hypothetical protein [Rhodanobacter glycinis]
MNTLRMIWLATIVLGIGVEVILLSLQAEALRRYGHSSFWLLIVGSACAAVYAAIGAIPYFITLSAAALTNLLSIGLAFALVGVIFGVWGTLSLFRRFGQLHRVSIGVSDEAA